MKTIYGLLILLTAPFLLGALLQYAEPSWWSVPVAVWLILAIFYGIFLL